ncbi:MAG: hypothetical protein HQ549_04160 [Candidatus Omnitrophica bacterium]|nr:hypothetical protein [Candidatus Omnitrophota bacterium]
MAKTKLCILIIACLFTFPVLSGHSQEAVIMPTGIAEQGITAIDEGAPHVSPGNVTVNFKEADIRAVLNYLAEVSGVDIVPAPDVSGPVTLKLSDKPWNVALDIIVKNYGYAYEREGGIIRVVTVSSLQQEELSTEVIMLNYSAAEDAKAAVTDMLTARGKLTFDSRTNSLIVTDLATNIYKIKKVIERIDRKTPQVMIEARILETLLEDDEKMGIDWTLKIAAIGAKRPTTMPFANWGYRDILPHALDRFYPFGQTGQNTLTGGILAGTSVSTDAVEFPSVSTMDGPTSFPFVDPSAFTYGTLDFSQFQAVLELLKQRRRTEIISNPRITTLNNEEAKILVGRVYNFPKFDQAEETGRWVISGYEAKELGIKLLVTPQVNENQEIVVDLKPEISNFLGLEKISEELSAPLWSTREADTHVMVKDGDTIFIGGLVRENNIEVDKKVPLLGDLFGDIPLVGGLFKHKGVNNEKTELIFFITVHIVKDMKELAQIAMRGVSATTMPADLLEKITTPVSIEKKPIFDFRKKTDASVKGKK